ncbi:MAPEG family protein [Pseudoduganella sp. UC29_106]|uniref:MAPEG family protein n=1 Tax=Pseudoduganella sp. UC29_106 TaxID=3374553 RepID=UPI0037577AD1
MSEQSILYPVFALAFWTSLVLLLIPIVRARAVKRREIVVDDFKYGESPAVPCHVSLPNRNYMNLLQAPMLFYVACIVAYVAHAASPLALGLAWAYVALRVVHSVIHLSYNNVIHRLTAFGLSNVVLALLWIMVWQALA